MDNTNGAPVIPAGTETKGGVAYNSLAAAVQAGSGQGSNVPVTNSSTAPVSAPEGTTFAELAAKKGFKSADDLAKAYESLESHNKKVEMTAADIIKAVYDANPTAAPVAPVPVQPISQQQTSDEAAIKIVQSIVKTQVKPLEERVALQDLFLKNPDASQYAEGIAKTVKENPNITWEAAYKLAKFDALEQKAKESGRQEVYQTIQAKQAVMAGAGAPTQRGGPDVRSIIKDRTVPFKEVDRMVREYLNSQGQ